MISINSPYEVQLALAAALRRARKLRKHSRDEAAKRSGVPGPTIKRFESAGEISLRQFLMLCEVYGDLGQMDAALAPPKASTMDELIAESRAAR